MCHWPLKGSRKAKKSERGANGRGPLPRRRLFFRRFFRGGDASKKARCSESQRRKIGRPRPHWRSGSVLTPPLEEQPGKTELSLSLSRTLSLSLPSPFPFLSLQPRFLLRSLFVAHLPHPPPSCLAPPTLVSSLSSSLSSSTYTFSLLSLSLLRPGLPRSSAFLLSLHPFLHPFLLLPTRSLACLSFLSLRPPLHVSFPPFPSCSTPVLLLLFLFGYDDDVRSHHRSWDRGAEERRGRGGRGERRLRRRRRFLQILDFTRSALGF